MDNFDPEKYRVLVVDDSPQILRAVQNSLNIEGFIVATASSGEMALTWISKNGLPHLALIDITMPGMDGLELCESLHTFSDLPIIMLTAVDEQDTIVHALDKYAEDYITKPFHKGELVARVRRVLRRIGDFAYTLEPVVKVDTNLAVNFPGCEIILEGKSVSLTTSETKLLYILMRAGDHPVTTQFLLQRLWPLERADENRLRVYIHRLRSKLKLNDNKHKYVKSKRGVGYIFQPYH